MRIISRLTEALYQSTPQIYRNLSPRMQRVVALAALAFLSLAAYCIYPRKRSQLPSLHPSPRAEPKASLPSNPATSSGAQKGLTSASASAAPKKRLPPPPAEETSDALSRYLLSQKCEEVDYRTYDASWSTYSGGCPKTFFDDFEHVEALVEWTEKRRILFRNTDRVHFYRTLQIAYGNEAAFNIAKLIVQQQKEPIVAFAESFYASRNRVARCTSGFYVAECRSGPQLLDCIYLTLSLHFSSESGTPLEVVVGRTLKLPLEGLRQANYDGQGITATHQIKTLKDPSLKDAPITWKACTLTLYSKTVTEEINGMLSEFSKEKFASDDELNNYIQWALETEIFTSIPIWLNGSSLEAQKLGKHFTPQTTARIARLICREVYHYLENFADSRWAKSAGVKYVLLFMDKDALHLFLNLTTCRDKDNPVQIIRCSIRVPRTDGKEEWNKVSVESYISSEFVSLESDYNKETV